MTDSPFTPNAVPFTLEEGQRQLEAAQAEQRNMQDMAIAMESGATYANGFQLMKFDHYLRLSFAEAVHPGLPAKSRGAVILPDQTARDLARIITEYYAKNDEMTGRSPLPGEVADVVSVELPVDP